MPLVPIIIAAIVALGGGTAALADSAKPGDALYSIDQFVEQLRERFTTRLDVKTQLLAKFADERVAELAAIEGTDPSQLSETAQQLWQEHRQEAIERVTASIAKVEANQTKFKEWLAEETDSDQQAIWQKVITQLDEVKARREARLAELQTQTSPGTPLRNSLREEFKQAREEHKEALEQIREEAKQEWEELREAQKQAQEDAREADRDDDDDDDDQDEVEEEDDNGNDSDEDEDENEDDDDDDGNGGNDGSSSGSSN